MSISFQVQETYTSSVTKKQTTR